MRICRKAVNLKWNDVGKSCRGLFNDFVDIPCGDVRTAVDPFVVHARRYAHICSVFALPHGEQLHWQ